MKSPLPLTVCFFAAITACGPQSSSTVSPPPDDTGAEHGYLPGKVLPVEDIVVNEQAVTQAVE